MRTQDSGLTTQNYMKTDQTILSKQKIWSWLEEVIDPEIPVLNVVEMGIVRDVGFEGDEVIVKITPNLFRLPGDECH